MEGLSIREIAKTEGIDYSSANESIKASQKKFKKFVEIPSMTERNLYTTQND